MTKSQNQQSKNILEILTKLTNNLSKMIGTEKYIFFFFQ